jgi:23S rRNA pseudouridine2457 synthase
MLIALHKPMNVLCQFTDRSTPPRATLAEFALPKNVYAAGRLDFDSEGLLLLTDDGGLVAAISSPKFDWPKTYLVQVEGVPDEVALQKLRDGVVLSDGPTRPAEVECIDPPEGLAPRDPPVRVRLSVPDAWLRLTIREGRNRQVRRMTAAVGLPTLRLIREAIGPYRLDGLTPGQWCELPMPELPTRPRRSGAPTVPTASKATRSPSAGAGLIRPWKRDGR